MSAYPHCVHCADEGCDRTSPHIAPCPHGECSGAAPKGGAGE